MDRVSREFYEDMLTLTSYPEWAKFVDTLEKEIYQDQADVLDSVKNWDDVCEKRGRCKKSAEIVNMRDTVKRILEL